MGNAVSHCEEAALAVEEQVELVDEPVEVVEEEVIEEEPAKREIVIDTAPIDPRFVGSTNQARNCFVKYNEAHRCFATHGGSDAPECSRLARDYRTMCPTEWIEKWNEARENGAWWGKY